MIGVEQALELLCGAAEPLETTEVELSLAQGRVLAAAVVADRDFPPTDRSAMDGFAVRATDVATRGALLEIVGELRAGQPAGATRVGPGQAVRIMTGAIVPPGADSVVMVEKTEEDGSGRVRIDEVPPRGRHIRPRGGDLRQGGEILEAGLPIRAAEIAALASVGAARVPVYRVPRVSVLSTGDEIVEPSQPVAPHQVRNSNAHTLVAQLRAMHVEADYLGIAGDEPQRLEALIARGLDGDLLLVTGGVSAGKYDLVAGTLADAGMELLFHKVAVKPGKPILAGRRRDCLVVGLPGNPVSTFTGFAVFVAPALRRMSGLRDWPNRFVPATLGEPLQGRPGRATYHLARIDVGPAGVVATCVRSTGSADVLALSRADGFIVTGAEGVDLAAGARVTTLAWRWSS